eukprot:UN32511
MLFAVDGNGEETLKIVDFTLAREWDPERPFDTICGSPEHVAPEVLQGYGYGPPVDWWGCGIIMYMLLCGSPPFYDRENDILRIHRKVKQAKVEFPADRGWDEVSGEAKNLILKLLYISPSKRATWPVVKNDPWLKNRYSNHLRFAKRELRKETLSRRLKHFVKMIRAINTMRNILVDTHRMKLEEEKEHEI